MRFLKVLLTRISMFGGENTYSKSWDNYIKAAMERGNLIKSCAHTITVSVDDTEVTIWTSNYPYTTFHPYSPTIRVRPSASTTLDFKEWEINQRFKLKH